MKKTLLTLASMLVLASNAHAINPTRGLSAQETRQVRVDARKLKSVCKSSFQLSQGQGLIKSQISNHIGPSDPRSTGYTFICGSVCASFPATIYYSDGTQAAKVGYYGTYSENGRPRAYCAAGGAPQCFVSSISATANRKKTGSALYLKINNNQCIKFNGSPNARNGGV